MGHEIVEAIIENGRIKYVSKKLPRRRMKVHLIYDTVVESLPEAEAAKLVAETSGIYKDIDAEAEARNLRASWERNVQD